MKGFLLEIKWLLFNSFFNWRIFQKTLKLKNSRKGKKLFLFANGPSLKILCPNKIKNYQKLGYEVFAINSFVRTDFFRIVHPDYYHIADPAHFLDFNSTDILPDYQEFAKKDHEKIKELNCKLFLPINRYNKFPHRNKYAVTHISNSGKKGSGNILTAFGHSTMTAYSALSIALFLGFDEIYICGFDNSWFKSVVVDHKNNLYYDHNHFYDLEKSYNKRLKISPLDGSNMGEYLLIQQRLFEDLYRFPSSKIVNLDPNSLVDAFTKKHNLNVYI